VEAVTFENETFEIIGGVKSGTVTVTVVCAVVGPTLFVAVKVYVVVLVGLTVNVPDGDVEVKVPGVILMLWSPMVAHESVLLAPVTMLLGDAVKEEIVGAVGTPRSA